MDSVKSVTVLYPYGTATQGEVITSIKSICIDEDVQSLENIISEWRVASKYFQDIVKSEVGIPEKIDAKEIDGAHKARLDKISSNPLFKQSYSLIPIEFMLVEIEKLVSPQRLVNLDYVQQLKSMLPKNPKVDDLITFCLDPKQNLPVPKKLQVAPNAFIYGSKHPDFRFLGGYPKHMTDEDIMVSEGGGMPITAIVLLFGYGSPRCNALSVGKRMILNNGFHRMYALLDLGIKYAPMVVQKVTNPDIEIMPDIIGLPKKYLIGHSRPVIMKDFFDQKLVRIIHKKPTINEVQISWNVRQSLVPV